MAIEEEHRRTHLPYAVGAHIASEVAGPELSTGIGEQMQHKERGRGCGNFRGTLSEETTFQVPVKAADLDCVSSQFVCDLERSDSEVGSSYGVTKDSRWCTWVTAGRLFTGQLAKNAGGTDIINCALLL